jgi:predicted phage terminase large subunit-like protein
MNYSDEATKKLVEKMIGLRPKWSHRKVAEACNIDQKLVSKIREQMATAAEPAAEPQRPKDLNQWGEADWQAAFSAQPQLEDAFKIRMTRYIPVEATPKQRAFLLLPHREALFGGACGGGKSIALLMAALQYVDVPGYSALILRKTLADLKQPGSLMARSHEWLTGTDAVWHGQDHYWSFPSGARLQFGYAASELDIYRYQSAEFQTICVDEVSQFYRDDYVYLLSRLRAPHCPEHPQAIEPTCTVCAQYGPLSRVPLRLRAATNPGGIGHAWLKTRFRIGPIPGKVGPTGRQLYGGGIPSKRPYIPAFLADNPFLDEASYSATLRELDPVTREQLLAGDWGVTEEGRFRRSWAKYYDVRGDWIDLGGQTVKRSECQCFVIVDPAATTRATPGKTELYRRQGSWSVIGTFLRTPRSDLIVWDVARGRWELPEITRQIRLASNKHHPTFIGMELTAVSSHLFQLLQGQGFGMRAFRPRTQDKISRSVDAANRMEQGQIFFPKEARWLEAFESELFTWIGDPKQSDDQVDVLSYAAIYVSQQGATGFGIPHLLPDHSSRRWGTGWGQAWG